MLVTYHASTTTWTARATKETQCVCQVNSKMPVWGSGDFTGIYAEFTVLLARAFPGLSQAQLPWRVRLRRPIPWPPPGPRPR